MSKKNYEAAASIIQREADPVLRDAMVAAFSYFFRTDNSRFDQDRFERACCPGANVRARS